MVIFFFYLYDEDAGTTVPVPVDDIDIENDEELEFFFDDKVRKVWHRQEEEWYLSIADVVSVLTDSRDVKQYIKKMRTRDPQLNTNWGTICTLVQMPVLDGKSRKIDEWKKCGITEEKDYAILTAEISRATFGLTPAGVTTGISEKEKPDTFAKSKNVAKRGGNVAGIARKQTEKELGRSVISSGNYLNSGEADLY